MNPLLVCYLSLIGIILCSHIHCIRGNNSLHALEDEYSDYDDGSEFLKEVGFVVVTKSIKSL